MPEPEPERVYFDVRLRHGRPEAALVYDRLPERRDPHRIYVLRLDTLTGDDAFLFNPQRGIQTLMRTYQKMMALDMLPASNLKK